MNRKLLATLAIAAGCAPMANASIIYSGLDESFEYVGGLDWTLAENQDRITNNVWIARASSQGIFNIAVEDSFQGAGATSTSPAGTSWAIGSTSDNLDLLEFGTWGETHEGNPSSLIGVNVVVYLEEDDAFIDLMFTSFGSGNTNGAFSYRRSVVPTPASASLLALGGLVATRRRR